MSEKNYKNSRAWKSRKCPFFCFDEQRGIRAITCEGTGKNTTVRQTFECKEDLLNWERKYCNDIFGYHYCPLYKLVCLKYEE